MNDFDYDCLQKKAVGQTGEIPQVRQQKQKMSAANR